MPDPITDEAMADLERQASRAVPAPWTFRRWPDPDAPDRLDRWSIVGPALASDAEFMTALRNAFPALVARIRAAEQAIRGRAKP